MKRLAILFYLIFCVITTQAQYASDVTVPDTSVQISDDQVWKVAGSITAEDLKEHLYLLASDSLGGRELGTEGNLMAADYIAGEFQDMGLPPVSGRDDYFQNVAFTWLYWDDIFINIHGERYKQLWDFIAFPDKNRSSEILTREVVFAGFGIETDAYSDYDDMSVEGKVVLIYDQEPVNEEGKYMVSGTEEPSAWSDSLNLKLEAAARHGASHVLVIADNIKELVGQNRRKLLGPKVILGTEDDIQRAPVDYTYISSTMAKKIIGDQIKDVIKARKCIVKKGKPKPIELETDLEIVQTHRKRFVDGINVAAVSEGTDLKDEYIIMTAHYDHIGMKGKDINNGADDNASGTSSILEVAEAFTKAHKAGMTHRRSVIFMLVTGEEKGLLGSKYYVGNPLVPLERSLVNINVDMVGRIHKRYTDHPEYIYVIGSDRLSSRLHEVNETVNQRYSQLILDYTYNAKSDPNRFYFRSDHYNFAKNGIPAIFFFNGTHEDYHRPTDTADKIEYDKMALVARHIFTLAWELATMEDSIQVDVQP